MKKTAVVYKSKYGSAKKYAQWLAAGETMTLMEAAAASPKALAAFDRIVYVGSIYVGKVSGFSLIKENYQVLKDKDIILCTVGLSDPADTEQFEPILEKMLPGEMRENIKVFHLRGGMDYSKLSWLHRQMMKMLVYEVRKKETPTKQDKEMVQAYGGEIDFAKKEALAPVRTYLASV